MTMALPLVQGRDAGDNITVRLWEGIEPAFLEVIAWDDDRRIVTFPQAHPRLGWNGCVVAGCAKITTTSSKLCPTCTCRWKATGGRPLEEFIAVAKREWLAIGSGNCVVPGCLRPWTTSIAQLCLTHEARRKRAGQSLSAFLRTPGLTGFPAFDPCLVAACTRTRMGYKPAYCQSHLHRWNRTRRAEPATDELLWRRTTYAIAENNLVSLRGLPDRIVAEVLYGLQQRTHHDVVTKHHELRPFVDRVRQAQVGSLEELDPAALSAIDRRLRTTMSNYAYLACATPESERHKDIWTAAVFGHSSNVAAGGQDCPIRFRCVGCGHFSTDISYLPDLERYLADLLRHRERLTATLDADEWAKTEAMPSDAEITRIRRLIERMKGDLDELTEDEHVQIEEAVAVVRRGRAKIVGLGIPRIRQPLPDLRPERLA